MLLGVWTEPKQVVKKAKKGGDNVFFSRECPWCIKTYMVGSNKLTSTFGLVDIVMHYQGKISKLVQAQNNKYIYI